MKNLKSIFYLRLVFSFLLVLFINVLLLNHSEVVRATEITQADISYSFEYQDEQGSWHNITSSGGVSVGYVNREYRLRFRFRLPETMQLGQPYDINFTLNHQSSDIRGINLTVADYNGSLLPGSSVSYDSLVTQSNNSLTRTTFNIYGFTCNTSAWVTLSFSYYSDSAPNPSQPTSGVLSAGIVQFSITDSSVDSILIKWQQSIFNQLNDVINSVDSVSDAIEHEETSLLGGLVDLGSDIIGGLGDLGSDILGGLGDLGSDLLDGINDGINSINGFFDDLEDGLLNGINGAINSINGFFDDLEDALLGALSDLGDFLIDGVYDLFVPSGEDLQDWIEGLQDDISDECPIIGSIMSIFTSLIDTVIEGSQVTSYHIPEVVLEFGSDSITLGNWDVPLLPSGFDDYIDYVRLFTSIIVGLAFVFMMYHRILNMLGIETKEEVEHDLDWYIREATASRLSSSASDSFWEEC